MNRHNGNHLHGMNEGPMELLEVEMRDELDNHSPAQKPSAKSLSTIVSDHALTVLNELREANLLCDAQISVGEQSFNVHRAIMCSCSSYFRWVGTFSKSYKFSPNSRLFLFPIFRPNPAQSPIHRLQLPRGRQQWGESRRAHTRHQCVHNELGNWVCLLA